MENLNNNKRVLDLSDEGYYFVKTNDKIVFNPKTKGQDGKFSCLYWIYMNSLCIKF